jgi:uncharacterized protein (DUF1778 family)
MKTEKKRKVGRPRFVEGKLQDHNVHFMIDGDRYKLITKAADKLGLNFSEYCKECITAYAEKIVRTR